MHKKKYHCEEEKINNLACIYCKKIYSALSNKCRHQKICKKNINNEIKKDIKLNEQILLLKDKEIELIKLKNEKKKLENEKLNNEIIKIQLTKINDTNICENKNIDGYIYIIHEREFIKSKENIYKIGRTENIIERIKKYPKNSSYCFVRQSNNMFVDENKLIKLFKNNFVHLKDYGNEYFKGDITNMIKVIGDYFDTIENIIENNTIENNTIDNIVENTLENIVN
jgi:hypothetical protein